MGEDREDQESCSQNVVRQTRGLKETLSAGKAIKGQGSRSQRDEKFSFRSRKEKEKIGFGAHAIRARSS